MLWIIMLVAAAVFMYRLAAMALLSKTMRDGVLDGFWVVFEM